MASDYTENIGLANPAPGDCNWDNDWHRNQYISDVCLGVLNSINRVVEGGIVTLTGGFDVTISAGSANVGGNDVEWVETVFTIDAAVPELEYESNWFSVDETGTITSSIAIPTGENFVALAVVDVDDTAILRNFDLRALATSSAASGTIISAIEKVLSGTGILGAFLYDVSGDSDLGAWTEKVNWTSYYNETLETATRGATRKPPKLQLIAFTASQVTIYDATDSDLPMWLVFNDIGMLGNLAGRNTTSVAMAEGRLCVANDAAGVLVADFTEDRGLRYTDNYTYGGISHTTIEQRNESTTYDASLPAIPNAVCNSIAITTLSGNDYPTIAVGTDGGVSVIDGPAGKGTVIDITWTAHGGVTNIVFTDGILRLMLESYWVKDYTIPSTNVVEGAGYSDGTELVFYAILGQADGRGDLAFLGGQSGGSVVSKKAIGSTIGLTVLQEDTTTPTEGSVNYITKEYQTGKMKGDIKLGTLMDTNKNQNSLVNGDFSNGSDNWVDIVGAEIVGGQLVFAGSFGGPTQAVQRGVLVEGREYEVTVDFDEFTAEPCNVWIGGSNKLRVGQGLLTGPQTVRGFAVGSGDFFIGDTAGSIACKINSVLVREVEQVGIDTTTEHVVNGTFDTDTSGWNPLSDATLSVDAQRLKVLDQGAGTALATQGVPTVIGQTYSFSVDGILGDSATYKVWLGTTNGSSDVINFPIFSASQTVEGTFKATSTTTYISLVTVDSNAFTLFDNVSIKAIQNIVENGEFSSDRAWTKGTGWTIASGVASWSGGVASEIVQNIEKNGASYEKVLVNFTVSGADGDGGVLYLDGALTDVYGNGSHSVVLEAPTASNYSIGFRARGTNTTLTLDNFVVYALDVPDRSVNANHLRAIGLVDKTPVAPGSELVAFSGFSTDSYLEQPYTSDMDFGAGDFHLQCWAKVESVASTSQAFLSKGVTSRVLALLATTTEVRVYLRGADDVKHTLNVFDGQWRLFTVTRTGNQLSLYINGAIAETVTNTDSTDTPDSTFRVGLDHLDLPGGYSEILKVRAGAVALSAEEIRETYNKEKRMFAPGAEITLSENQVKCISYDEDSDTLKVGVTDGASAHFIDTFQGGIKIDSAAVASVPVSIDHTFDSKTITQATEVAYSKEAVNLRELV